MIIDLDCLAQELRHIYLKELFYLEEILLVLEIIECNSKIKGKVSNIIDCYIQA